MEAWSNKQAASGNPLFCVLCRAPIKFEEGTKRIIEIKKEEPPIAAADAFGDTAMVPRDDGKQGTELAPIDKKNAEADANNPAMLKPNPGGLILPPVMAPDNN